MILSCFKKHPDVEAFYEKVPTLNKLYYAIIKEPICLRLISEKISYGSYENVEQFIDDMNLLFKNCSTYNIVIFYL